MLAIRSPKELRADADKHRRWAVTLETAGQHIQALEHFGRAMRLQDVADALEQALEDAA